MSGRGEGRAWGVIDAGMSWSGWVWGRLRAVDGLDFSWLCCIDCLYI